MNYWLTCNGLERIELSVRDLFTHLFKGEVPRLASPTILVMRELLAHPLVVFSYCEDDNQKRFASEKLPREYGLFGIGSDELSTVVSTFGNSTQLAFLISYIDKRNCGLVVGYTLMNRGKLDSLSRQVIIDEFLADNL